ncbi:hypothetical protein Trydic_g10750 [Trypoxylus dichotomus]
MNEKFTFSWINLSAWYTERSRGQRRQRIILDKVTGTICSGSLVAVMGLSGAGKTTFLATLAGKNKDKEGSLLLNNCVLTENYVNQISNYVYQKDIILESLTVSEHMKFMSAFKLDKSPTETELIIRSVLDELSLENCKNTYLKHLSGGEKKRISLAVELLNDPLILFCDEPTSGLDSSNAIAIIQKLKNRVLNEKLVVVTIHQPSSQIFDFFSHVILLGDKEIVYHGTKDEIADYFASLNLYCPINYNPAEFYIKCITLNGKDVKNASKTFCTNKLFTGNEIANTNILIDYRFNKLSFYKSIYWLVWRSYVDTKRNIGYHTFQFLILMLAATFLASFYSSVESNEEYSVQNIKGILYFFTSELIFTHTYNVVNTFPEEFSIFLREKPLYSAFAYFVSKIIAIIPRNIIQPLLFLLINFVFVKFLSGCVMFLQIFGVMICACLCGSMLGLCISSFCTSLDYMDLFIAPFELITMLAAGILINVNTSGFFRLVKYLSPFYYTYESLSILYWSRITGIDCQNATVCYSNGTEVLEDLGFHTETVSILWNIVYMIFLSCFIGLASFSAILYKRNRYCY